MHASNTTYGRLTRLIIAATLIFPAAAALRGLAQHIETSSFNAAPAKPKAKAKPKTKATAKRVAPKSAKSRK